MNSKINCPKILAALLGATALAGCDSIKDVRTEPYIELPAQTVVLQGTITGLSSRRSIVLMNNGNADEAMSFLAPVPTAPVSGDTVTPFSFGAVPVGSPYNIEVRQQPYGKQCTVANGSGTISTAQALNITVNCVNNVPRYSVTVQLDPAFSGAEGAKVTLTTEEAVYEISPAPGATSVVFPDAVFNSATSGGSVPSPAPPPGSPNFEWSVIASTTVGGTLNKCPVTGPTGTNPTGNVNAAATGNPYVRACSFTIGGTVSYSQTSTGTTEPAMPAGGVTLELRNLTGQVVATQNVAAFGAFSFLDGALDPVQFQSNAGSIFDLAVASHPPGMTCVAGNAGAATLYAPGLTSNPANITNLAVWCREVPAADRQLHGIYRHSGTVWQSSSTATPVVVNYDVYNTAVHNTASSNMMAFFRDGTFLYGTHANAVQVEHGFYEYDPVGQTLRFRMHTDTNPSTNFPGNFSPTGGIFANSLQTTPGLSATPGPVVNGGVSHRAMSNVILEDGQARISGRFGPGGSSGSATLDWVLEEPRSIDNQMTGTWMAQDHRRFWVYDALTYYGTHVSAGNGAANMNDACFTMADVTAASSYYTRRGTISGCYPWNRPADGQGYFVGFNESVDFSSPALSTLPGYIGRMPGGQSAADGRSPSPIYFHVAPAATYFGSASPEFFPPVPTDWCTTEILGVRATLNGAAIDNPVYFCRTRTSAPD